MKKIILILAVLFVGLSSQAQRSFELDFDMSTISGTDTTLYFSWFTDEGWSMQYDWSDFNADDAIIDWGQSNNDSVYVPFINDSLPYTINTAVKTNDMIYSRIGHSSNNIVCKITKGSVTSGTLYIRGRNRL